MTGANKGRVRRSLSRVWTRFGRDRSVDAAASPKYDFAHGLAQDELQLIERCQPFTMTNAARLIGVLDAVDHVTSRAVPGAIVECGVWSGGSMLMAVLALQRANVDDRELYLFDTFEGMTQPTTLDTSRFENPALQTWTTAEASGERAWGYLFEHAAFGVDQVRALLVSTGYPSARVHMVQGRVEDTVPESAPDEIAVLRLDTDWYESTRHELTHLFPRLAKGGVLIIDDYGHWEGCRRAVDEYFGAGEARPLLARLDYTGRMGVKV
jgi:hypothetical protein